MDYVSSAQTSGVMANYLFVHLTWRIKVQRIAVCKVVILIENWFVKLCKTLQLYNKYNKALYNGEVGASEPFESHYSELYQEGNIIDFCHWFIFLHC